MFRDSASPSRSRSGPQGSSAERGRHNAATSGSSTGETASVDPGAPFVPAACSLSPSCAESDNLKTLHIQKLIKPGSDRSAENSSTEQIFTAEFGGKERLNAVDPERGGLSLTVRRPLDCRKVCDAAG